MGGFRKFLRRLQGHVSGFSLIEVMIAGGLIAFIAIALLPAVISVTDTSKTSGFKAVCSAAVRAKLNEYVNGVADGSVDGNMYAPSGFEYTKRHYQQSGKAACDAFTAVSNPGAPGFREAIYGSAPIGATAAELVPNTNNQHAVMTGFQLWVMIRRYNPRKLVNSAGALDTTNGTPQRDCPPVTDQFYRLGDAFEVTVTGMVRTDTTAGAGGRNGVALGKLYDIGHPAGSAPNPLLTCSATELIYPPRVPFRYYVSGDGKIRNYQAGISFNAGGSIESSKHAMETHFRSIWVQPSGNSNKDRSIQDATVVANIRSIAVSPDNQWVYVLRPGELARYGPCSDSGGTVLIGGSPSAPIGGNVSLQTSTGSADWKTYPGTPDCSPVPSIGSYSPAAVDGLKWNVSPSIESIAVNFGANPDDPSDDSVYAMLSSVSGLSTFGNASAGLVKLNLSSQNATYSETADYKLPNNHPRIRGIFIAQTFPAAVTGSGQAVAPNLFFFDNTCYTVSGTAVTSSTYCASIFNSADSQMQQAVRELPLQVEAISY